MPKKGQTKAKLKKGILMHRGRACAKTLKVLAEALDRPQEEIETLFKSQKSPGKNAGHLYDIEEWRDWIDSPEAKSEFEVLTTGEPGVAPTDKKAWETRRVRAQALREELRAEMERGEVINQEEVVQFLGEVLREMSRRTAQAPKAMAADLSGLSVPEFTKRLGDVHRGILEDVTKSIQTKKKAFWQRCSEMLSDLQQSWSLGDGLSDG
jgi:hypothetical protein